MKLLLCLKCNDIFNLRREEKKCSCGESGGRYVDDLNAEIYGDCIPIGFANNSFIFALRQQVWENKYNALTNEEVCCKGTEFEAFTIPDWAKSIKRIDISGSVAKKDEQTPQPKKDGAEKSHTDTAPPRKKKGIH